MAHDESTFARKLHVVNRCSPARFENENVVAAFFEVGVALGKRLKEFGGNMAERTLRGSGMKKRNSHEMNFLGAQSVGRAKNFAHVKIGLEMIEDHDELVTARFRKCVSGFLLQK